MDEITAVEILRKVLTGNQKDKVPLNSVQKAKQKQKTSVKANPVVGKSPQNTRAPTPEPQPNYLSDSKYEENSEDDEATVKQSNCSRSPRTADDDDWDSAPFRSLTLEYEEANAFCNRLGTVKRRAYTGLLR